MLHSVILVFMAIIVTDAKKTSSLSQRDDWIINGEDATIEEVPYQVAYLTKKGGTVVCGGSLLSESLVVTAAHCAIHHLLAVRVGTNKRETEEGQIAVVKTIVVHENYNNNIIDNDIALLFLESPVTLGDTVKPIELPEQDQITETNTKVLISGWGTTESGVVTYKELLQKVTVPIIDQEECKTLYPGRITEGMICAGFVEEGGKDACQGDSGGPLVADSVLLGITSWGYGCAEPNEPGVYTRVAKYVNWIREQNKLQGFPDIP